MRSCSLINSRRCIFESPASAEGGIKEVSDLLSSPLSAVYLSVSVVREENVQ